MNLNGRKVAKIQVHAVVHANGMGQLLNVITTKHKKDNDLQLTKIEDGVLIVGFNTEVFVPNGNIISMTLLPEVKEEAKAEAKPETKAPLKK